MFHIGSTGHICDDIVGAYIIFMESENSSSIDEYGQRQEIMLQQYIDAHPEEQLYPHSHLFAKNSNCIQLSYQQCQQIRQQVQFYLSPVNLMTDVRIRKQMEKNKDKWLSISYLLRCHKIQNILSNRNKQNLNCEIEISREGKSRRSLVRMMAKILNKSDKLVVKENKVRSREQLYHRKNKITKDEQSTEKELQRQKNMMEKLLSKKQAARMLYIEVNHGSQLHKIEDFISSESKRYQNKSMEGQELEYIDKKKQVFHRKLSQKSQRWMMIHCSKPEFRDHLQAELSARNLMDNIKTIKGEDWLQYQTKFKEIKEQLQKLNKVQNREPINN